MRLTVLLRGYDPDKASDLKGTVLKILEVADIGDDPVFEELPALGSGDPYLEIFIERESGVFAIVEQMFVQRVYERLEISGATTMFFEAGDFMRDGWIKKLSRYKVT